MSARLCPLRLEECGALLQEPQQLQRGPGARAPMTLARLLPSLLLQDPEHRCFEPGVVYGGGHLADWIDSFQPAAGAGHVLLFRGAEVQGAALQVGGGTMCGHNDTAALRLQGWAQSVHGFANMDFYARFEQQALACFASSATHRGGLVSAASNQ